VQNGQEGSGLEFALLSPVMRPNGLCSSIDWDGRHVHEAVEQVRSSLDQSLQMLQSAPRLPLSTR
jgi:hypothetical protein